MPRIGVAYLFSVRTGATRRRGRSTSKSLLRVSVRRLNDTGKSGWRALIGLVPVVAPVVHLVGMSASRPLVCAEQGRGAGLSPQPAGPG
ncbi:DUF805 domain-containing protein [Streptomyces sp. NBC_00076]|uniref:DUF805 domain-containing protein n=1 Tax=Streptomyces sp. NBC_00076 TaxID=2975642 RepID=UPI00386D6987